MDHSRIKDILQCLKTAKMVLHIILKGKYLLTTERVGIRPVNKETYENYFPKTENKNLSEAEVLALTDVWWRGLMHSVVAANTKNNDDTEGIHGLDN